MVAAAALGTLSTAESTVLLRTERTSTGDLEVGGDLAGLPLSSTRFVRYEDLLPLPQERFTVSDDTNFHGTTQISGVALDVLAKTFGKSADMIVAICYDHYRTNYPQDMLARIILCSCCALTVRSTIAGRQLRAEDRWARM
jgi:hypothetical protein